jgi:hypothetical protein
MSTQNQGERAQRASRESRIEGGCSREGWDRDCAGMVLQLVTTRVLSLLEQHFWSGVQICPES